MTELSVMPKMQLITPDMVKASVKRARRSLEAAAKEIVWQIEVEGWRNLNYRSWDAMRIGEYGGAAFMLPSKLRPEYVARIKEIEVGKTARGEPKYLTDQAIADTAGVSERQVKRDLSANKTGQMSSFVDDDVIDAEIVEDDPTPNTPTDPAPAEPVNTVTCPTCNGTGKVTP